MKIFLVGGAIRDKLLGLPVKEKDWVVVGATPEEMLEKHFQPVGKEFPVFLHPKTHEEYALARTERKVGKGYKGFTFYAAPDVTLEEDLKRRDLTINAIAETPDEKLIDPYDGQRDLKNKIFRHVSSAFQEDPVRILRVARLATKFPDFTIHPDTLLFMKNMVKVGEVNALVPERVWQEWARALNNKEPKKFFDVLSVCDALPILFPEICLDGKGVAAVERLANKTSSGIVRFAALLSDLAPPAIQALVQRYRIPNEYADLALLISRYRDRYKNCLGMGEKPLLELILATDALRRNERFEQFLATSELIDLEITSQHRKRIEKVVTAIKSVDIKPLQEKQLKGEEFATALEKLRLEAIRAIL